MDFLKDPEFVNIRSPIPSDVDGLVVCTKQAPGAIPNETIVEKIKSTSGDGHPDGSRAKVIGSIGPGTLSETGETIYGYWVVWEDVPDRPCFIASVRIRPVSTGYA